MIKKTYFIHRDAWADQRQSDGLEFCKIPEFHADRIYFYCDEYALFWSELEAAGNPNKALDFHLRGQIEPANLEEIGQAGLLAYVDGVKQYHFQGRHLQEVCYMELKQP